MVLKLGAFNPRRLPPDATAVHFPNGQLRKGREASDHLDRLLAPDATIPLYRTVFANIAETVRPEKLPPLEVTSTPVAPREEWGMYRVNRTSGAMSVAIHVGLFGLLWSTATSPPALQQLKEITRLVAPPTRFEPVEVKQPVKPPQIGRSGGGIKAVVQAPGHVPPRPVVRTYTPPVQTAALSRQAPKLLIPPESLTGFPAIVAG